MQNIQVYVSSCVRLINHAHCLTYNFCNIVSAHPPAHSGTNDEHPWALARDDTVYWLNAATSYFTTTAYVEYTRKPRSKSPRLRAKTPIRKLRLRVLHNVPSCETLSACCHVQLLTPSCDGPTWNLRVEPRYCTQALQTTGGGIEL